MIRKDRFKQLVEMVSEGHSNKEIGYRLGLKEGTVKEYLNAVYKKTKCSNRTELAIKYIKGGLNEFLGNTDQSESSSNES